MSLINQMLKDIDKRQGHTSATASGMPLAAARGRSDPPSKVWVLGGAVLVLVVAGVYGFRQMRAPVPAPAPAPVGVSVAPAPALLTPAVPVPVAVPEVQAAMPDKPPSSREPAPEVAKASVPKEAVVVAAVAFPKTVAVLEEPKAAKRPEPLVPGQVTRALSAEQRADNAYRDAAALLRQGRAVEAQKTLQQALTDQPSHQEARLLYAQVLQGEGRASDARAVLTEGITLKPQAFALHAALAQMQLLGGDTEQAVTTLERGLLAAGDNAAYHALLATALQQQSRHAEAVTHYVVALRQQPDASNWLVGLGVSLQAQGQAQGAAEAYQRALDLGLPASLSQFARDRLQQVSR